MARQKIVRENQISVCIGKVGFMDYRLGISRNLLHVLPVIHIVDLELGICDQDRLFALGVFLDDLEFG